MTPPGVLVIDDDENIRTVLQRLLTRQGFDVRVAADGAAALALIHDTTPPDAIVLDLTMPVMSGFEVLSALRVNPGWSRIPVIVLSGDPDYSADHLHVAATLSKPFVPEELEAALRKVLRPQA